MTDSEYALKDPSFSYRSEIITTSLECDCDDCIKFLCYGKPMQCIDPYLTDMRYTHGTYRGLAASKTASTREKTASTRVDPDTATYDPTPNDDEPKQNGRKC